MNHSKTLSHDNWLDTKTYEDEQVGILSEHALEFAWLTEKRLGRSKFSNSIFERFRWVFDVVFSSNPKTCFAHFDNFRRIFRDRPQFTDQRRQNSYLL